MLRLNVFQVEYHKWTCESEELGDKDLRRVWRY